MLQNRLEVGRVDQSAQRGDKVWRLEKWMTAVYLPVGRIELVEIVQATFGDIAHARDALARKQQVLR